MFHEPDNSLTPVERSLGGYLLAFNQVETELIYIFAVSRVGVGEGDEWWARFQAATLKTDKWTFRPLVKEVSKSVARWAGEDKGRASALEVWKTLVPECEQAGTDRNDIVHARLELDFADRFQQTRNGRTQDLTAETLDQRAKALSHLRFELNGLFSQIIRVSVENAAEPPAFTEGYEHTD